MTGGAAKLVVAVGCLLLVIGVAVAVTTLLRARRKRPTRTAPPVDPFHTGDTDALRGDPRLLAPGDVVEIRAQSYVVRGSLRFTEGGWSWAEHLIDDTAGGRLWLSVEEDPDLTLTLWTEVPGCELVPDRPAVDFEGRRYLRDETGQARYTATGATGLHPTGTVRYADYAAGDGALLSFESYGDSGRWEVSRGERLHRAEVLIYSRGTGDGR